MPDIHEDLDKLKGKRNGKPDILADLARIKIPPVTLPGMVTNPQFSQVWGPPTSGAQRIVDFGEGANYLNSPDFQNVLKTALEKGFDALPPAEQKRLQKVAEVYPKFNEFLQQIQPKDEATPVNKAYDYLRENWPAVVRMLSSDNLKYAEGAVNRAYNLATEPGVPPIVRPLRTGGSLVADIFKPIIGAIDEVKNEQPKPISSLRDTEKNPPTIDERVADENYRRLSPREQEVVQGNRAALGAISGGMAFMTQSLDQIVNPEKYGTTTTEAIKNTGAGLVDMIVEAPDQVAFILDRWIGKGNPFSKMAEGIGLIVNAPKYLQGAKREELYKEAVDHLIQNPESLPFAAMMVYGPLKGMIKRIPPKMSVLEEAKLRSEYDGKIADLTAEKDNISKQFEEATGEKPKPVEVPAEKPPETPTKPAQGEVTNRSTDIPPEGKNVITDKQPWEMTREEYVKSDIDRLIADDIKSAPQDATFIRNATQNDMLIYHKGQVREALQGGKPVPPSVLADYPDLAAKYKKPAPPQRGEAAGKIGGEMSERGKRKLAKIIQRSLDEDIGQSILDDMDAVGESPKAVNEHFWANVYHKLPPEVQTKFDKYAESLNPGGVTWGSEYAYRDASGKLVTGEAKTWGEAGRYTLDMPDEVQYLEGTQRGLIALEKVAEQKLNEMSKEVKSLKQLSSPRPSTLKQGESVPESGTTVPKSGTAKKPQGGGPPFTDAELSQVDRGRQSQLQRNLSDSQEIADLKRDIIEPQQKVLDDAKSIPEDKAVAQKTIDMAKARVAKLEADIVNRNTTAAVQARGRQPQRGQQQETTTGERVSYPEIVKYAEDSFGVKVRVGRFSKTAPGASAIYKTREEVIRQSDPSLMGDLSHEVAHHLDKKFKITQEEVFSPELAALDYDPMRGSVGEGFAEYMRHWLTESADPAVMAPEFTVRFNKWLTEHPEVASKLQNIRDMIRVTNEQGAKGRVEQALTMEPPKSKFSIQGAVNEIQRALFDIGKPLENFVKEITEKTKQILPAEKDPFKMFTALKYKSVAKADQFINTTQFDFDGNITGPSLKAILEPVKGKEMDAIYYAYAKHAIERWAQGKNPGITLADARTVARDLYSPEFDAFAKSLAKYRENLLDYVVDAGGLDPSLARKFKEMYEYTLPLYRTGFEGGPGGGAGGGKGMANLPRPIKGAKGSGRQVINPLPSLMQDTYRLLSWADRQRVAKTLIESSEGIEGMGAWVEKVDTPSKPFKVSAQDAIEKLKEAGFDVTEIPGETEMGQLLTFWSAEAHGVPRENIVTVFRDGKLKMYQLHPDLYKAITGMDNTYLPGFWKLLTIPKQMIVAGATALRPSFGLLFNPLRDPWTYFMQSESPAAVPFRTIFGHKETVLHKLGFDVKAETELFFRQGGDMANVIMTDLPKAMQEAQKLIKENQKGKFGKQKIFSHPFQVYRELVSGAESGPRVTEFNDVYNRVLAESGSHRRAWIEGINAAQKVTLNFSRNGYISHFVNQLVPFFNASMQDISMFTKHMKENPLRTTLRGVAGLTVPTLALWYMNKDEDWYKALPTWRKVGFWNFKIGDTIWGLPKPFTWGSVFAAIPEGIIDAAYQKDPDIITQTLGQALQNWMPDLMPAAAKPWIEVSAGEEGYDFFRDRPIVSPYDVENLPPTERYYAGTSETAKAISKGLAAIGKKTNVEAIAEALEVSPAKIDHLLSGVTGGLGKDVAQIGEGAYAHFVNPRPEEYTMADWPFVGRLAARPPYVSHFYEKFTDVAEDYKKANLKLKRGETLSEKELNVIVRYKDLNKYRQMLSDIRKTMQGFMDADGISLEEKRQYIQTLETLAEETAKEPFFSGGNK